MSAAPPLPAALAVHERHAVSPYVPEVLLHDLWRHLDFDRNDLRTTCGLPVRILDPGTLQAHDGPDFAAAVLRIGDLEWHGDVELHRASADWLRHGHHEDPRYDRVILHVVLTADEHTGRLRRHDGSALPELVLGPRLRLSPGALLYRYFTQPGQPFPCAGLWARVPERIRRPWLRLLGRERLLQRAYRFGDAPPEEQLYRSMLRALGYGPNDDPMEQLALRVPLDRLRLLRTPAEAEALLLGTAGLLEPPSALPLDAPPVDAHVRALRALYDAMAPHPPVLPPSAWRHGGVRPANAPARRIAQAAALFGPGGPLHADPLGTLWEALNRPQPLSALTRLLTVEPDTYWRTHTRPGHSSRAASARLGRDRVRVVLLGAVLPALYAHAVRSGLPDVTDRLDALVERLPASSDRIVRLFERAGAGPHDALEAQGLHHLYRTRCTSGACLTCTVGRWALGR